MNRYKRMHEQWVKDINDNISGKANFRGVTISRKEIDELSKKAAQDSIDVENILRESYALAAVQP
jgi:hypothetical protein